MLAMWLELGLYESCCVGDGLARAKISLDGQVLTVKRVVRANSLDRWAVPSVRFTSKRNESPRSSPSSGYMSHLLGSLTSYFVCLPI
jgi:hypothetical protein